MASLSRLCYNGGATPSCRIESSQKTMPKSRHRPKNKHRPAAKRLVPKSRVFSAFECGLCGRTENVTKTECCGHTICDDEDNYVLFSYARNSCSRNHRRFTLCGGHFSEGHEGEWQSCEKCRGLFETEMYVWFGTNEYNFETLPNPPSFKPTRCSRCNRVIKLGEDAYSMSAGGYKCENCMDF